MVHPDAPHRLIVEGPDDLHSVIHLTKRHGIDWDNPGPQIPYVAESGGCGKLIEAVSISAKIVRRLGILVDADIEPADRWKAIRSRLEAVGVSLPERPAPEGTIVSGLTPGSQVGVWLMPDNTSPGALEDFLVELVPKDDRCWPYAEEATSEAQKRGAPFPNKAFLKARIHTWLAWQENPGCPFGMALNNKYFRCDSETALGFVAWFQRLFLSE